MSSSKTFNPFHCLSIWDTRVQVSHAPEKHFPLLGNQVGVPTLTSTQLCSHSNQCGHSHSHSPMYIRVTHPILHVNLLSLLLQKWSSNQPPQKYPRLKTTMIQIKFTNMSLQNTHCIQPNHPTHPDYSNISFLSFI